jgi:hypothetical protein
MYNPTRSPFRTPAVVWNKDWCSQERVYCGCCAGLHNEKFHVIEHLLCISGIDHRWVFIDLILRLLNCWCYMPVASNDMWRWSSMWGLGRSRSSPVLRYDLDICVEKMKKAMKTCYQDSRQSDRYSNRALPATCVCRYDYTILLDLECVRIWINNYEFS